MKRLDRYSEYKRLREQGKTYQEIGDEFGVTKQAVYCSLNRDRAGGGKNQRLLMGLEVDAPVFVQGFNPASLRIAAWGRGIKLVIRTIERGGEEGLWVCRIK